MYIARYLTKSIHNGLQSGPGQFSLPATFDVSRHNVAHKSRNVGNALMVQACKKPKSLTCYISLLISITAVHFRGGDSAENSTVKVMMYIRAAEF